jgi:hypothetical protein
MEEEKLVLQIETAAWAYTMEMSTHHMEQALAEWTLLGDAQMMQKS